MNELIEGEAVKMHSLVRLKPDARPHLEAVVGRTEGVIIGVDGDDWLVFWGGEDLGTFKDAMEPVSEDDLELSE